MKADKEDKIELTGVVVQRPFAGGSKSEHDALYLQTGDASYRLRRLGGNAFSDPVLNKLIGKTVKATGLLTSTFFMAHSIEAV